MVDGVLDVRPLGEGDALITDRPGIGLVAQTADCTPILLFDPERRAVAAVHCGWRGVVVNVVGAAVSALVDAYGSRPDALIAGLGPAISREHYRVGPEVLAAVGRTLASVEGDLIGPLDAEGGATLDVSEAVRRQLVVAGLRLENVERVPACTYADARFFSSRRARGARFGSQGGIIALV
jgi:YfiH family protein